MIAILISILIFVISVVLAWLVPPMLGLGATAVLVLRILLVVLGAVAAGIILFFHFRDKRRDAATKNIAGGNDMDTLLRDAEKHLASAQRGGARTLDTLPLLYILGDSNSAKTTAVLKSGFDPELLAGQVYRDQDVVATPVVNIWFAHESVFVEAGDAIRKAPALWNKLIRKTRPKAMSSAMGKQAPVRAAVVCVSVEQFLGATASDAVVAAARQTNQMLRDLALTLGTEIPVYVVMTKLDRMPHFNEYVRNLTTEEASQPLGMAFPRNATSSGLYAEKAMGDVTAALDRILFSLGEYRLELLNRENDQNNVDPVYEFPREMRKLRNNLASYLVELARPSHLNANPYLRGFYCTGVRAHMVEQMVAAAAAQPKAAPAGGAGATRMFTVESMQAMSAPAAPQMVTRKQAQWCFLPRIFPNVILEDRSALAVTSNSQRTHLFRRVVLGTVSFLLLLLLIFFTISWANNSRLEHQVAEAARSLPVNNVPPAALASAQSLGSLDQLRAVLVQLEDYKKSGPPFMYRWGLYHGDSLLEGARRIYFDRFRRMLLNNTQANLVAYLNTLPPTPAAGADYSATYNPLKAYLITTSNNEKSTQDFLAPVLVQYWLNGKVPEAEDQRNLAARQFDFYAGELPQYTPYNINPDTLAVSKARAYLSNFGGIERIYQSMLTAAGKVAPGVDFNKNYPGSATTVVDGHVVQGAFTRAGFTFMQDAIRHPDRYYNGEVWVLGNQAQASLDLAAVSQQLANRYVSDYENEWRAFLRAAQVQRYRGLGDAANKLQMLSNPGSPLLELFFTASHNTAVANQEISKEFQPTAAVVPPDSADRLVGQGNQGYMTGLLGLQSAVSAASQDPTFKADNPAQTQPIVQAQGAAHTAASQTAQAFNIDPQAHVEQISLTLLQAPITAIDDAIKPPPPGAGFCDQFKPLMSKFPFSPTSQTDATPAELQALLQPGSGALWQFYDQKMKALLVPQSSQPGTQYAALQGAPFKVNPAFLHFFNKASALSAALYPANNAPGLTFNVHILHSPGIQSVAFVLDNQPQLAGSDVSRQFTWTFATAQQTQITANYGSNKLPLPFSGQWALFHFVNQGKVEQSGPVERLAYPLEIANTPIKAPDGTPLIMRVELSGPGENLLVPGALSDMRCVSPVGR